ncbi:hypothetical protein B0H17DRAFT_1128397 [Mycena rosella]|uniref:Uncharacterized protein n=1 Tax=Mycena rosella TaxID=1033263 RepID=A0AAD7DX41_MYCRO|nr:hypothetical protein B0H17DRAFT_1128397 [Mycena rosella]
MAVCGEEHFNLRCRNADGVCRLILIPSLGFPQGRKFSAVFVSDSASEDMSYLSEICKQLNPFDPLRYHRFTVIVALDSPTATMAPRYRWSDPQGHLTITKIIKKEILHWKDGLYRLSISRSWPSLWSNNLEEKRSRPVGEPSTMVLLPTNTMLEQGHEQVAQIREAIGAYEVIYLLILSPFWSPQWDLS